MGFAESILRALELENFGVLEIQYLDRLYSCVCLSIFSFFVPFTVVVMVAEYQCS